ncbi:FliI/YscN family ATPase [Bryobacter aggregatus]|uniref:FliI/YscN family ATPase n=1 Tax=Bryobacter aggregatus TaxID=360054 RepID=UPI0004E15397|nr:FliI/YscN family ATPase [Bryobacter aggregatus]
MKALDIHRFEKYLLQADLVQRRGRVTDVAGMLLESEGPAAAIGDFCEVLLPGSRRIRAQVIGFRNGKVLSMPLEDTGGLAQGATILARTEAAKVRVGPSLLGRVLDGFGQPMDGGPSIDSQALYDLYAPPPGPLQRENISEPLVTGIRVIDSLLTCGKGQRIGLFGGSGVGKSTLLGSMCKHHQADVAVIALIGERNREVKSFLEHELGPEGRERSVMIAATSDQPAPLRLRACFVALAVAEYFRDQGKDVLLVIDSVTRLAMAQREIGLAAGEPPGQKGYPPSAFQLLPKIFERAGRFPQGSITGFFTVLVEGDDFNEPVCDTVRAILDGHIILSRQLGAMGHYPAINVLESVSRLQSKLAGKDHKEAARNIREALAAFERASDLIQLGAYVQGSNPLLDSFLRNRAQIDGFLRQDADETSPLSHTLNQLQSLSTILGISTNTPVCK